MNLEALRAALKQKNQEVANTLLPAIMKANATDADISALEKANADMALLERQIVAAQAAEDAVARSAAPVAGMGHNGGPSMPANVAAPLSKEAKIGLVVMGLVASHKHHVPFAKALEDNGYGMMVKELVTTTPSKGGVTIPTNLSDELIPILRPNSAFLQLDPQRLQLPNGNLTIPRQDSGVSGGYTAEATDIIVEEPTFSAMTFSSKKLAVIVPLSNELINWSPVAMESFVRGDISLGLGMKMDLALLRGDGSSGSPTGIVNKTGVYSFAANATVSIQNVETDLAKAESYMDLQLIPNVRRKWVMSPRTLTFLSSLRDGNGNYAYPTLQGTTPTLRNKPVLVTTQIPVNLGGGTNASEVYLIEASEVWFAQPPGAELEFEISTEAMYKVSGVAYSAFQRDVTLIRGIMRHDTDIRRLAAVVKITAVLWGA